MTKSLGLRNKRRDKNTLIRQVLCSIRRGKKQLSHISLDIKSNCTMTVKPILSYLMKKELIERTEKKTRSRSGTNKRLLSDNPKTRKRYVFSLTLKGEKLVDAIQYVDSILGELK